MFKNAKNYLIQINFKNIYYHFKKDKYIFFKNKNKYSKSGSCSVVTNPFCSIKSVILPRSTTLHDFWLIKIINMLFVLFYRMCYFETISKKMLVASYPLSLHLLYLCKWSNPILSYKVFHNQNSYKKVLLSKE